MEKDLIEACLNNWLGYGNINSPVWFLGIEEGGAEINGGRASDSEKAHQLTLEESLKLRRSFKLCEDFYEVWQKKYGCDLDSLLKKPTTWKFIAAFLLSMNGDSINTENVKNFIIDGKSFGTKLSNHFLCEFYALPKRSVKDWNYELLYATREEYYEKEGIKRLNILLSQIEASSGLQLIICYNKSILKLESFKELTNLISEIQIGKQEFCLYELQSKTKKIKLLITPFFGNGRISYNGIDQVVEKLGLKTYFLN